MRRRGGVLVEAALSALGVWGALACVVTAFGWKLALAPLTGFCLAFALALAALGPGSKRYAWACVILGAMLVGLWFSDQAVLLGMRALAHAITKDYRVCYPQVPLLFAAGTPAPGRAMPFLWWLAAVLLLLSSLLHRWFWPQVLLTLPLLCLPLAVTRVPGTVPLLALASFWLTALCTARLKRRGPQRAAAWQLYFYAASLLFLVGVGAVAGQPGAQRPPWALRLQQTVLSWGGGLGADGAAPAFQAAPARQDGQVALTQQGPRRYTGRTMLELETDYVGTLYLRGATSGDYTGKGWAAPGAPRGQEALYFPAQGFSGDTWAARLTPSGDRSGLAYLPQYPWRLSGAQMQGDQLALTQGNGAYEVTFCPGAGAASGGLRAEAARQEEAYRQALGAELQLPEQTAVALRAWAQAHGLAAAAPQETAERVAQALRGAAVYDQDTPRQPADEDFVLYFLDQSRRGYCVHFASAATALLRALGVPARYVQGYALASGGGAQAVPDSAAHAWTEYYVEGKGWLLLDATEGAQAAPPVPQEEDASTGAALAPPVVQQEAQPQQEASTVRFGALGPETAGAGGQAQGRPLWRPLMEAVRRFWYVPAALALAALLWLRRAWVLRRRRRVKDRNRAALDSWRRYSRMCRRGAPPLPEARRLAEKAKFSNHVLTAQELGRMRELEARQARLCQAQNSLPRRLWERWVLCLY